MNTTPLIVALMLLAGRLLADDTNANPASAEAAHAAALERRTTEIVNMLALDDTNKIARVHDIVLAQYGALTKWHNDNDPKLKTVGGDTNKVAQIRASLKVLHDGYLARLAEYLSSEQIDKVKNKMTYNKVEFTYLAYVTDYSGLSETNKQEILRLLKLAREDAMDASGSGEKTAIFQRYKARINNYISKQGIRLETQNDNAVPAATNPPSAK